MHPNTWKQSNMVGVNHLCMVQGNEESISSFVFSLFCVFMVIGLTMDNALCFVESDGNGDRVNYGTMPFIL